KELTLLEERFTKLYQDQDRLRQAFTLRHRRSQYKSENQNFNQVDEQKELFMQFSKTLKGSIEDLRAKMAQFSEVEVGRIDRRKENFYQGIAGYLKQYYPEDFPRFQLLETPLAEEEAVSVFGLDQPLLMKGVVFSWRRDETSEAFAVFRRKYFTRHKK